MSCLTSNLFSRGMVTVSTIAILLTLCLSATPTSAAMRHEGGVKVAGDLDDTGGITFDLKGGGSTALSTGGGPEAVVSLDLEREKLSTLHFEMLLIEFNQLWIRHR